MSDHSYKLLGKKVAKGFSWAKINLLYYSNIHTIINK